jgi:hypothetical protein
LLIGVASPAQAALININASDYALGTNLTALTFPTLTIDRLSQAGGSTYAPTVSAVTTSGASTAQAVMNVTNGFESYDECVGGSIFATCQYSVLELRFDTPTDLVSLSGRFFTDAPFLIAFDALGNRIATFGLSGPGGLFTTTYTNVSGMVQQDLTLTRASRDIARIVYGGDNNVSPTRVSYQVPEPATLSLVGLGLAGAAFLRRRKRRH